MGTEDIAVDAATRADLSSLRALIREAGLDPEGIESCLGGFLVARSNGRIVGTVGLEFYGSNSLLRSLAVEAAERRRGIGATLCRALVRRASHLGVKRLFLLTVDSAPFFRGQGFRECDRSTVPEDVASSAQFGSSVCKSAASMTLETLEGATSSPREALQDVYPGNHCFGCGPGNERGLRLKSYWSAGECLAAFRPAPGQNAGPSPWLNGGIIATLIDCHSIFTAISGSYEREERSFASAPHIWCVTASLAVHYWFPTAIDRELGLVARIRETQGRRTTVHCALLSGGRECATGEVVAARVREGWGTRGR